MSGEALGEAVLEQVLVGAHEAWGSRLVAAYALGSLAHGGFSALVSDVDLGLILRDPLEEEDGQRATSLASDLAQRETPLADRLSVFWGSPLSLRGRAAGGRFPPLDRLDLVKFGRLLDGADARDGLTVPSQRELVVAAARLGLDQVQRPAYRAALADASTLVAAGPRSLTKVILFPVRFLYTARTGAVGRNDDAVRHFVAAEHGPTADLAAAALRWREEPPASGNATTTSLVEAGLRGIYELFLADHAKRMDAYGETTLADAFRDARRNLGDLAGRR